MALDNRDKRASAFGVGRPWNRTKEPDVTLTPFWRAASGNVTGMNAFTAPTGGGVNAMIGVGGLIGPGGLISGAGLVGRGEN